jgi:membrane-anchored protein YejM (alkaline phosphatase superfamily)
MKNYLGVTTKIHDYSVGEDLLGSQIQRDWILASSYSKYGIVTPKNILEVGAVGQFEILDKKNQPMSDQEPNYAHVQAALEQISRFNK